MPSANDLPNCSPASADKSLSRLSWGAWLVLSLLGVSALWANAPAPRRLFLFAGLVLALVEGCRRGSVLRRAGAWFAPFAVVALLSALWSIAPVVTVLDALAEVVAPIMVCLLACTLAARPEAGRALPWLLFALVFAGVASVLGGLHAHLGFWPEGPSGLMGSYAGRGIASTAGAVLSLLAVGLIVVFHRAAPRMKWLAISLLLIGMLLGVLGHNRMYWFALLVGGLPWLPELRRLSMKLRMALVVGLVVLMGSGIFYSSYLAKLPTGNEPPPPETATNYAKDARWVIWHDWLGVAAERPVLGYGYGSRILPKLGAEKIVVTVDPNAVQHAHNVLLNVVIQTGFVGLGAFLLMLVGLARLLGWGERLEGEAAYWRVLGSSILLAALAKSLTDDFFWSSAGILMWLLVGLAAGRRLATRSA